MVTWVWRSNSPLFLAEVSNRHDGPAPLFAEVADGPRGGTAVWAMADDKVRIRLAHWGADAPRGTVFLFPGRTEYIEKYGRTARDLLDRGFGTLAVDWRGQGLADRLLPDRRLGHVGRFSDYQKDVAAMVAHARLMALPRPWYLVAHSMGGCIALRALIEGLPVQSATLTSPMWGIQIEPPVMRPVAWILSTLARPIGLGTRIAPTKSPESYLLEAAFADNDLTTDARMWDYMKRQVAEHPDLGLGGPTLQWLNEALLEMRHLARQPSPPVPCLTLAGTDERIVDPLAITDRMSRWPEGRLMICQGASHEILMEGDTTRAHALDAIAAHFLA
jgi:lysophospholipase